MGLEYLDKVYKSMFAGGLGYLVIVSKSIGAFILVLTLWKSFFRSFSKSGKVFSEGDEGFSPYTLFRMLGLLLLVGFSTQILDVFDSACAMVESEALKGFNNKPDMFTVSSFPVTTPPANESAIDGVLRKIGEVVNMMNPTSWTGGAYTHITQFMLKILDFLIYPVFLAERYFFMGLIKIFVPLMIALSIFDKTKDYIYPLLPGHYPLRFRSCFCEHPVRYHDCSYDACFFCRSRGYGYFRRLDGGFSSYTGYSYQNQAF
jgi:hypothetical protein